MSNEQTNIAYGNQSSQVDPDTQRVGQELAQAIQDNSPAEEFVAKFDSMVNGVDPAAAVEVAATILGETPAQVAAQAADLEAREDDLTEEDLDDLENDD